MRQIKYLLMFFLGAISAPLALTAQKTEDVILKVTNIPTKTGSILFLVGDGALHGKVKAEASEVKIVLKNLASGRYKVNVFHDANGNWSLDKDERGIPSEYCAQQTIEVTDSIRSFSIALVDVQSLQKKEQAQKR